MALNAVCQRGMLGGKLSPGTDYRSFPLTPQPADIIANGAAGSIICASDHRGHAVNEMKLGSLGNFERNIRDPYSGDEFGCARSKTFGVHSDSYSCGQ
jgi:hypothetical protein